ncbi:MAG: hypothetical protein K2N94_15715, partial [Lachnospiraceae bacterium]|nr:hypothetical protein [Lachnospiraceae bacterium]
GQDELLQQAAVPAFSADKVTGLKIASDAFPSFTVAKNTGEQEDLMVMYQYSLLLSGAYSVPVLVDFTTFSELMQNYVDMPLGELVSYHAQDKQQYGLTTPGTALTVIYTDDAAEDREFTVCFGSLNEEQTHYYVCLEGSSQTFLMEREKAETLLRADTFSIVDRYTQMINITLLGGMNIAYGDAVRRVDITHTSETNASGTETIADYFTVDGKALNEEDEDDEFRTLYQHIIALKLTRELTEEDRVSGDAALTLEFLDTDGARVLRSVRYLRLENSDQELAVEVDGACLFAADAPSINKVIELLRNYQP